MSLSEFRVGEIGNIYDNPELLQTRRMRNDSSNRNK